MALGRDAGLIVAVLLGWLAVMMVAMVAFVDTAPPLESLDQVEGIRATLRVVVAAHSGRDKCSVGYPISAAAGERFLAPGVLVKNLGRTGAGDTLEEHLFQCDMGDLVYELSSSEECAVLASWTFWSTTFVTPSGHLAEPQCSICLEGVKARRDQMRELSCESKHRVYPHGDTSPFKPSFATYTFRIDELLVK